MDAPIKSGHDELDTDPKGWPEPPRPQRDMFWSDIGGDELGVGSGAAV